jgi:hypothetical protein
MDKARAGTKLTHSLRKILRGVAEKRLGRVGWRQGACKQNEAGGRQKKIMPVSGFSVAGFCAGELKEKASQ